MSEGDDRRPAWLPLAVLAVVAAGIVAVSMVGGSLTHQADRSATPSIPAARTSTTTLLSSTSSAIPTISGGFVFGVDDLCEWVSAEEVAGFVDEAFGWQATVVEVASAYQGGDCNWELRDSDGEEGRVYVGQADWQAFGGSRYALTQHMTEGVVDFAELGKATVPVGVSVSGHPSLSDGVVVYNGGYGQFAFGVPPRDQYLEVIAAVPGEEEWEQQEPKLFSVANDLLDALGWLPTTIRLEPVGTFDPVSTSIGTIEFSTWRLPQGVERLRPVTATAHVVVAVVVPGETFSEHVGTLVWSNDGVTWSAVPVSIETFRFTPGGDDLIVYDDSQVVRLIWDGTQWVEQERLGLDGADQLVVGPNGIVATRSTQVFYSIDGSEFTVAEQPPSRNVLPEVTEQEPPDPFGFSECTPDGGSVSAIAELGPLVATNEGFIALTARNAADWNKTPACEPLVWFSTDGNRWELVSKESPFDPYAYVTDIAATGGRLVAIGGINEQEGAMWASDDGLTWERVDLQLGYAEKIAAGPRGWILLGATEPISQPGQMWFSANGTDWDGPYERPVGWWDPWPSFLDAAILDDRIVGRGHDLVIVGEFIDDNPVLLTPVDWQIDLDDAGPGIHTLHAIVDVYPLTADDLEDLSGRLVWDKTVVDLCAIAIRKFGDDYLHIGDIFQTTEGCGSNPTALQDAFDEYGMPATACVTVTVGGVDYEYCSPLN